MTQREQKPVDLFPPIEFVREEMEEREWDDADLVRSSGATDPVDVLSLELFLACDPREKEYEIRMGDRVAELLSLAFGISKQCWLNLEAAYIESRKDCNDPA